MRQRRRRGASSAEILRVLAGRGMTTIPMVDHFQAAFGLDSYDVAPIGGWFADGSGELDDAAVSALLDVAITRRGCDAAGDDPA
ncbi:MAG: hypothetical protein ACRDJH_23555 [Thermomicrobiales bacterium]